MSNPNLSKLPAKVKRFPNVLAAVYSQPWAITEDYLATICGIVETHAAGNTPEFAAAMKAQADDDGDDDLQMVGNVAVIDVMGPIFPRANLMTRISGATDLSDVSSQLDQAIEKADAIVMRFDSPGGAVQGMFECADKIFAIRGLGIPIVACVEGMCASAAYCLASQCDSVYTSSSSILGSVSVVMRMASDDRAQRNEGIDSVTIKSGNLKQAGDPASLAFAGQYQSLLSQVNTYHDMFTGTVQRARPLADMAKVSTGDIYIGKNAIAAGLADEIGNTGDVIASLQ